MKKINQKLSPGQLLVLRKLQETDPASAGEGWLAMSERYTDLAADKSGQDSLSVLALPKPGIDAPGIWVEAINKIILDGDFLGKEPHELEMTIQEDFLKLAKFHGIFIHEVGHAEHTNLDEINAALKEADVSEAVKEACVLLEEIRMEAQVVKNRPQEAKWLRACAKGIILGDMDELKAMAGPTGFMVLTEGRVAAGSLLSKDVDKLTPIFEQMLGQQTCSDIFDLCVEICQIEDDEYDKMIDAAKRLAKIMEEKEGKKGGEGQEGQAGKAGKAGQGNAKGKAKGKGKGKGKKEGAGGGGADEEGEEDDNAEGAGGGGADEEGEEGDEGSQGEGEGEGEEDGNGNGKDKEEENKKLQEAIKNALDGQEEDAEKDLENDEEAKQELDDEVEEQKLQKIINETNKILGQAAAEPGGKPPQANERRPNVEERATLNRLVEKLRRARWRDRVVVQKSQILPPGKLHARQALQREAEIAQGKLPQAEPWRKRKRRHSDSPSIACGILIDTSGSMGGTFKELSAALWVLHNAITRTEGKAVGIGFGDAVAMLAPSNKTMDNVLQFAPRGGTAGVPKALEMIDKDLQWENHFGPRLIVAVSDGLWYDNGQADKALEARMQKGVKIIHVGVHRDPSPHKGDKTVTILEPKDLVQVVGGACIEALSSY